MRISVEMAQDMGLIPDVSPYQKTWYGDRMKTNAEYIRAFKRAVAPYDYDEKTHTVLLAEQEKE